MITPLCSEPAPASPRSRLLEISLKTLSAGLAIYLIGKVWVSGGADMREEWRHCDASFLSLAFIFVGFGIALSSYRWARLLTVQEVYLSGWDAIRLSMIGVFFNTIIPGGVGGDVVKLYKLKILAGDRFPEALSTTLFDRVLGLLGLFLIAILAVGCSWDFLRATHDTQLRYMVSFVFTVAVVGALGVLGALYYELLYAVPGVQWLVSLVRTYSPPKIWRILCRIVHAIALFRVHFREVALALALSMLVHTSTALAVCSIGHAVHAPKLQVRDYFLATQIANTISAVPVTPGGLGARDFILVKFFHAAGEGPKANVIPPIYSLVIVLWSIIGSLFYFLERKHLGEIPTTQTP